jgi:hypothetical protein
MLWAYFQVKRLLQEAPDYRMYVMSETMKIVLMFILLIGAFFVALRIAGWRIKKTADAIIRDLKKQKAFDQASAVPLPYSKGSSFHVGLRDYRPKALELLVKQDVVRVLAEGKYYLREEWNTRET